LAYVQQYPESKELYGQFRIKIGVLPDISSSISIFQEAPSGLIDGVNTTYTLARTPILNTESVYRNGMYMRQGALHDYVISGKQLIFQEAPLVNTIILINYKSLVIS